MQYQPGDSVGVLPHNSPHLVQGLLQHLGQSGNQVFSIASSSGDDTKLLQHLGWPCTLEHALSCGCDLTSIPRSVWHVQLAQTVCVWQSVCSTMLIFAFVWLFSFWVGITCKPRHIRLKAAYIFYHGVSHMFRCVALTVVLSCSGICCHSVMLLSSTVCPHLASASYVLLGKRLFRTLWQQQVLGFCV